MENPLVLLIQITVWLQDPSQFTAWTHKHFRTKSVHSHLGNIFWNSSHTSLDWVHYLNKPFFFCNYVIHTFILICFVKTCAIIYFIVGTISESWVLDSKINIIRVDCFIAVKCTEWVMIISVQPEIEIVFFTQTDMVLVVSGIRLICT